MNDYCIVMALKCFFFKSCINAVVQNLNIPNFIEFTMFFYLFTVYLFKMIATFYVILGIKDTYVFILGRRACMFSYLCDVSSSHEGDFLHEDFGFDKDTSPGPNLRGWPGSYSELPNQ